MKQRHKNKKFPEKKLVFHFLGFILKIYSFNFLMFKTIEQLDHQTRYLFLLFLHSPSLLLSQSCLDLLYSPLINCLHSAGPARLWSPRLLIRTRQISDHRSTTLPTGRQVKCPLLSAVSTPSLYGVYQILGSGEVKIGSAGGRREISRAEICTSRLATMTIMRNVTLDSSKSFSLFMF